ncbi:histidine--tRNA ligase [Candidatus Peregrinibacteria bacterium]|jgi:histidyl-tRNA synthetase|nr:histidine--tRNA ligase [Candidatus Peregrinibacteria bacterium]
MSSLSDNIKNTKIKSPEGCHDILPKDQPYFALMKKVLRRRARQSGIERITPCTFEHSSLFQRSIGEGTDIISKELFCFDSKSGKHNYALRPELTAGVARAYIEHGMASLPQPVKLYSFEPVFRYDRPQKNRYRQFYQWSVEVIGERDPGLDAQMIHLAYQALKDLKIERNVIAKINSLGSIKERKKYTEALKNFFYGKERNLCFNCQDRVESNPLRILDCKEEDCKILSDLAPKYSQFLKESSKEYFDEVKELLDTVKVPYEVDETLVRGLDYYCDTVFEFVDKTHITQQNTIIAGGRYDGLIEQMGGTPTPAFGFACGVERLVNRMKDFGYKIPVKDKIHVYVAQLGSVAKKKALPILQELHDEGIHAMGAIGTPSIRAQLRNADKFNADWALIMGQIEVQEGIVILRNMKKGSQETVPFEGIVKRMVELVGEKNVEKIDFFELDALKEGELDEDDE